MRCLKYGAPVGVCIFIYWVGFLALKRFQLEGVSLTGCVLMLVPLFSGLVYQCVNRMKQRNDLSERYEAIIMSMQEQMACYQDLTGRVGGSRHMKCILDCRELAHAIAHPGHESLSLMLHRLAYIETLLNDQMPVMCRRMPERERQMWDREINTFPVIGVRHE